MQKTKTAGSSTRRAGSKSKRPGVKTLPPRARRAKSKNKPFRDGRSPRLAGRPAAGGKAVGATALVDAACDLLRTLPPDKITRAVVARHAKVNPTLINYHFRDQSSLLRASARALLDRFQTDVAAPLAQITDPEEKLRARIEGLLRFQLRYPFFHRLLTEEVLAAQTPEGRELLAEMSLKGTADYAAMLRSGEVEGTLRHVDPTLIYLCIVGVVEQAAIGRPILEAANHALARSKDYVRPFADFVADLLLNGLRTRRH